MNPVVDIDLDDIVRHIVKVKLNGKVIDVEAPDLLQLMQLVSTANKLKFLGGSTNEEALEQFDTFSSEFLKIFPELKSERLTLPQLERLITMMVESAMPLENKELSKRGITKDLGDQKKSE